MSDDWKRWYDHLPRRLYMLRWLLLHGWSPTTLGIRGHRLRQAYWVLVHGYETEICDRCGRPVRLVFHVPDAIWELVAGTKRSPGGEAGGGILCPVCVDELYEQAVPRGAAGYLRWTCRADDSVMRDPTPST